MAGRPSETVTDLLRRVSFYRDANGELYTAACTLRELSMQVEKGSCFLHSPSGADKSPSCGCSALDNADRRDDYSAGRTG